MPSVAIHLLELTILVVILEADRAVFDLELLDIGEDRRVVRRRRVEEVDEYELGTLDRCRELRRQHQCELESLRGERERQHHQVGLERDVVELNDATPQLIVERADRDLSSEKRRRDSHHDAPCELLRG